MSSIYKRNVITAALVTVLVLFLSLTDPGKLPLPLLIVPFLVLFCLVYVVTKGYILLHFRTTRKRKVIAAGVVAMVPTLLLMFQSIHQLNLRDVVVIVALACVTGFYVAKADFIN